jgi:hypothetical protein
VYVPLVLRKVIAIIALKPLQVRINIIIVATRTVIDYRKITCIVLGSIDAFVITLTSVPIASLASERHNRRIGVVATLDIMIFVVLAAHLSDELIQGLT